MEFNLFVNGIFKKRGGGNACKAWVISVEIACNYNAKKTPLSESNLSPLNVFGNDSLNFSFSLPVSCKVDPNQFQTSLTFFCFLLKTLP